MLAIGRVYEKSHGFRPCGSFVVRAAVNSSLVVALAYCLFAPQEEQYFATMVALQHNIALLKIIFLTVHR